MLKTKVAINSTDIEGYGNSFYEIEGYSSRLKHSADLEEAYIPSGMMCFKNVSYDDLFLIQGDDYCVLDQNNKSIIMRKYGKDVFVDKKVAVRQFARGFVKLSQPYVLIGGMLNYWHWINNFLPRIFLAKKFFDVNFSAVRIIVHDNISQSQINHLKILGIEFNQLVFSSVLKNVVIDNLYVPTFFSNQFYCRAVADDYKKYFSEFLENNNIPDKTFDRSWGRVYLSRQKARGRRVYNQDSVQTVLDRYGFETVFAEELSEVEQFKVFKSAGLIVSPHGAGLANLNFSGPGTKVVIFEYKKGLSEMKNLSLALGLNASVIECEQRPNHNNEHRLFDLFVDVEKFESVISELVY